MSVPISLLQDAYKVDLEHVLVAPQEREVEQRRKNEKMHCALFFLFANCAHACLLNSVQGEVLLSFLGFFWLTV